MIATLITASGALLGVVLGGTLTYLFARRTQVSKALHDSRIIAFARFGAATMEYRRALMERWHVEHGAEAASTAKEGVYETRSAAWAALFEVQLLTAQDSISQLARKAIDTTSAIKNATDRADLAAQADLSRKSVEEFVSAARSDIAAGFRVR